MADHKVVDFTPRFWEEILNKLPGSNVSTPKDKFTEFVIKEINEKIAVSSEVVSTEEGYISKVVLQYPTGQVYTFSPGESRRTERAAKEQAFVRALIVLNSDEAAFKDVVQGRGDAPVARIE